MVVGRMGHKCQNKKGNNHKLHSLVHTRTVPTETKWFGAGGSSGGNCLVWWKAGQMRLQPQPQKATTGTVICGNLPACVVQQGGVRKAGGGGGGVGPQQLRWPAVHNNSTVINNERPCSSPPTLARKAVTGHLNGLLHGSSGRTPARLLRPHLPTAHPSTAHGRVPAAKYRMAVILVQAAPSHTAMVVGPGRHPPAANQGRIHGVAGWGGGRSVVRRIIVWCNAARCGSSRTQYARHRWYNKRLEYQGGVPVMRNREGNVFKHQEAGRNNHHTNA